MLTWRLAVCQGCGAKLGCRLRTPQTARSLPGSRHSFTSSWHQMRLTNGVSRTLGFNALLKGLFLYSSRFLKSCSYKRRIFYMFKYRSQVCAGAHSTHSLGFIMTDAPPTPLKKKINIEGNTELEKVFFSILFIGTIWEAANQLTRAFRLLDKGVEGKIQEDGRQTCLSQAKEAFPAICETNCSWRRARWPSPQDAGSGWHRNGLVPLPVVDMMHFWQQWRCHWP